jgi:hypothetical protein
MKEEEFKECKKTTKYILFFDGASRGNLGVESVVGGSSFIPRGNKN